MSKPTAETNTSAPETVPAPDAAKSAPVSAAADLAALAAVVDAAPNEPVGKAKEPAGALAAFLAASRRARAAALAAPPKARLAAAVAGVLSLGLAAGYASARLGAPAELAAKQPPMVIAAPDWSATSVFGRQETNDLRRIASELRSVRGQVENLRESAERSGRETASRLAQVTERLERLKAGDQELAQRVGQIAEKLEREPRFAQIIDRLERMEKPATPAPVAQALPPARPAETPKVAEPAQTGSLPAKDPKEAQPKAPTLEGWALLEVYDGVALVEGPNQRLYETSPGRSLPRIGRVEAIEKRGRTWVLVTARGVILPPGKAL